MRTQPDIVDTRAFTKEESAGLLEPWLGSGLSLDDLPVPRVIVARIAPGAAAGGSIKCVSNFPAVSLFISGSVYVSSVPRSSNLKVAFFDR